MRYFETKASLLEKSFPFPFQTTFTFIPAFIFWTQVNLILTVKPTLLYLLSWLLFGKLLHKHSSQYCSNYGLFILSIETVWSNILFVKLPHGYNIVNKSTSHLVTALSLQKCQTLVSKHLRYQNNENSSLQEPPSPLKWSSDFSGAPAHAPGWLKALLQVASPCPSCWHRARKGHIVNANRFDLGYLLFIYLSIFSLSLATVRMMNLC